MVSVVTKVLGSTNYPHQPVIAESVVWCRVAFVGGKGCEISPREVLCCVLFSPQRRVPSLFLQYLYCCGRSPSWAEGRCTNISLHLCVEEGVRGGQL